MGAWLSYLQLLNNLVASGYRLTQCISTLEGWTNSESQATAASPTSYQILSAWDELAKATSIATATVKSHIVSKLQDFITQPVVTFEHETDLQRAREHNQYVVHDSFQTLVNLQHQFSVASCEFFVQCIFQSGYPVEPTTVACATQGLTLSDMRSQTPSPAGLAKVDHLVKVCERFGSGSTQASSEHGGQFEQIRGPSPIQGMGHLDHIRGPLPNPGHLLTMKTPFYRGSRSPLNFPLFPSNGQRRWSETAAVQTAAQEDENQARRWSMPWEHKTDKQNTRMPISKLAVPMHQAKSSISGGDRSQSTSDSSVDGLTEAIQLLSCKPVQRTLTMQHSIGAPFIEEPGGMYGIWAPQTQVSPHLRFMKEQDRSFDENAPP